ncbi:EmrB/QacA subfamily drug resistance transporter [Anaerosolibacter carboniphilus]|uniref:EmrB/QacA subfamily drug resistance transporter n=1 Tax=Anaerosolibacter carboniphilus TaxID=1417629 RepID=A0A841KLQ0_9FIRM|nr:DHA2 family efflux MFS transporter permease subunit [Anaerosolibacter carboniphilus]MBB6214171.1 EmrB/QacA subfamily drug resistance transporter [Anaerosolibacter carboniphilus]
MHEKKNGRLDHWLALFVVIVGTFMAILDSSIVNIAVPKMMAVFGVSLDEVKWILTSYTLALGAIIPLTGFLGEVYGSKKVYMFALGMFTLGSLLCGFAWSNTSMIVFRIVQALGGGMIMPVGMSIIYQIIPPEERGLALGFWGISAMAAPAIGPTLGGYIIEHMDWRLIFNVNVPIGVVGVILAGILLKDTPTKPAKNFDYIGFLSSTIGIVSILYVLGEGSSIDWSDIKNPMLLTLGGLSLVLFVVNELTHPNPLLELRIFKIFDFTLSQCITCILTFALMGGTYVLPLFLQNLRGYTAMQTGMILFPSAIAVGIMMPISGGLFDRIGAKPVVLPGLFILGITSLKLAHLIDMNTSKEAISWILLVRGLGLGLAMMPISTAGMNAVPPQLVAKASALSNTIRQIAGALSVTIMTTLIQGNLNTNYARMSEQVNAFNQTSLDYIKQLQNYFMASGLSQNEAQGAALSMLNGMIQKDAYINAMKHAVEISVIAVVCAAIMVLLMRSKKKLKGPNDKKAMDGEMPDAMAIH